MRVRSAQKARNAGVSVKNIPDAVKDADVVMILAPDEQHKKLYKEQIEPNLKNGATLAVAHGFSIHFGFIQPREKRLASFYCNSLREQGSAKIFGLHRFIDRKVQ